MQQTSRDNASRDSGGNKRVLLDHNNVSVAATKWIIVLRKVLNLIHGQTQKGPLLILVNKWTTNKIKIDIECIF